MGHTGEHTIALSLEGLEADNKHIRLDDFLAQLRSLQDAISCVDYEVNGRTTLYCRVVDLSHSSPATVKLEMVLRDPYRNAGLKTRYRNSPQIVHNRFFDSLESIREKGAKIENTSEETIEAFVELVTGLGRSFSKGIVFNNAAKVPLDIGLSENLDGLTKPGFISSGSVTGNLLSISFARGNKFYLYPPLGPTSIACHFSEDLEKKARACIKRKVRVTGKKLFRPNTGLPFRVDVSEIEELRQPRAFIQLVAPKTLYKGEPAHEAIARLRNEW